jgi:hypothetical protein
MCGCQAGHCCVVIVILSILNYRSMISKLENKKKKTVE